MLRLRIGIKQKTRALIFFIVIGLLSSCATYKNNTSRDSNYIVDSGYVFDKAKLQSQLAKIDKWIVKGAIGIQYNGKADSASYIYSQDGDKFDIKLYGPLGVGSVEIKGDKNKVTLIDSKGNTTEADNVKSLMLQQLGWYVPVDGLKYWIKAMIVPGITTNYSLDKNNLLKKLSQKGWNIVYQNYEMVDDLPLPTKLKMNHDKLSLKIVIKSWKL